MAQDFHELFPLNDNDKMLNDADLHGVALAAIQRLDCKLKERELEIRELRQQNQLLESRLNDLQQIVRSLAPTDGVNRHQ